MLLIFNHTNMGKFILKFLKMFLIIVIVLYIILFFYRNNVETSLTFVWKWINQKYDLPKNFEEINIKTSDNNNINWIFLNNNSQKTVFYFHGNGWPINYYFDNIIYIWNLWYNVISYDYPWYWKSTWYPLEQEVYKYSQVFFDYMKKTKSIKIEDIIVFWHSIWTWIWTDFAYKNKVDKIILISPLSSRYEMSKQKYSVIIQKILFMKNSFNNLEKIKTIQIPTLIIHWTDDVVINYYQWKQVFDNSSSKNKYFITLNNFWHNWIIEKYWDILKPYFLNFLKDWKLTKDFYNIDLK